VSKHVVRPGKLRLGGSGLPGDTQIELDGEDIASAVTGLSLRLGVYGLPEVTLDVVLHELDAELEHPRVILPDATKQLLVRLGWTPPAEEAQS
jgi:hypothetical protein